MRLYRYLAALSGLVSLCSLSTAEAVVASAKSIGMGGVGIAYAQDAIAAAANPAAAADVGNEANLGFYYARFYGNTKIKGNVFPTPGIDANGRFPAYYRSKSIEFPDFGINFNPSCNWSVGMVFYDRNYSKTTYKVPNPLFGTTRPGLEYINYTGSPYIAYKWGMHNFGVSLDVQATRLKVNGLQNFDHPVVPILPYVLLGGTTAPGHVTNNHYSYAWGVGVTLGYLCHVTDDFSIGLTFRPKTRMERYKKYKGFLPRGRLDIPQKIGFGVAWRYIPCSTISLDVEQILWSKTSLHNSLLHPIPAAGGIEGLTALGGKNGPGFGWRNQIYFRTGIDFALFDDWVFRAGFRHVNAPIRKSQTAINTLTLETVQNVLTAGATWNLNCKSDATFVFAYGFNHKIHGKNSIPFFLGGGEADIKQSLWLVGLSYGYKF